MPYCSVLQCKNASRTHNITNAGISYHRFPVYPTIKEGWLKATGRTNWMPVKSSTICSKHFAEEEFLISKKGLRTLKPSAVPTIKILNFIDQESEKPTDLQSDSSKRLADFESEMVSPKKSLRVKSSSKHSICLTSNQKLKGQLRWSQEKIKKQHLKIRHLQAHNRYLKKKLNNLEQTLETPKDNDLTMPEEFVFVV